MLDMIIDWSGMAFVLAIVIYFIWVSYKEMKAREKRYAEEAERDRERSKKQEEASKRYKEFQEVTDWVEKATKKCLLDELEAISRGEKRRLSSFISCDHDELYLIPSDFFGVITASTRVRPG
jgi:hypothetical protein